MCVCDYIYIDVIIDIFLKDDCFAAFVNLSTIFICLVVCCVFMSFLFGPNYKTTVSQDSLRIG